jgi:signal transduction histidine kinase
VLTRAGPHVIALRADASGRFPAVCTGSLLELRAALLGVAGQLPRGYELEIGACQDPGPAAGLRRAVVLEPGLLCFTLRNPGQSEFVEAAVRRTALLRGAFLVLALMCVVGGWATWRALVRERRLAELRTLFVANVSHELRTPLASILLLSENLASGRVKTPEQVARYHAGIQREALRLRELVDSVLDMSRLERGRPLAIERAELDLSTWWASTSAELSERARAGGAELELVTGRLEGSANVDGDSLRRALSNLVDNALKHSGDARLVADADVVGDELVLGVRDHGKGIPAARRDRLFEPFERLDDGPQAAPGTGLGLSIVRAIAVAHGGRAACVPVEPGARFELAIPLDGGRA